MKKYCIDCANLEQKCVNASSICENFKWKDKRLEAGEFAMSVLWRLAHERYYKSDGTPPSYYGLAADMMDEYETCEEIMDGCERDKNMNKTCEELNDEQ